MSALSPDCYPAYAACISNKKNKPLGWGSRPALLILDVGRAYFSVDSPVSLLESTCGTGTSLATHVETLVAAARKAGCPVVWAHTVFTNRNLRDAGLWAQKVPRHVLEVFYDKDERGLTGFLPGLEPSTKSEVNAMADLVIDKKFASCFFGTNLVTQLTMLGADTVVVCGARTGGEIRQSILDAQGLGFRGIVVADACADISKETHYANLFDMQAKMSDVVKKEDAVKGLERGWSWA